MTLVIRHSLSEANNYLNRGTPAFGHPDAPLMPLGITLAQEMGERLRSEFEIDPRTTPVAVSKMARAQETASAAGFVTLNEYSVLDEVDTLLPYSELRAMIDSGKHSETAIKAAELILERPPEEEVWVTHGLVIAALCDVLGVRDKFENFVPVFCEVRNLDIQGYVDAHRSQNT